MKAIFNIICIMFLAGQGLWAQQSALLKKADAAYEDFAYSAAILDYEAYLKRHEGSVDTYQKLADSYFYNANLGEAAKWYEKMIKTRDTTITAESYFRAAQSYKYLEKYQEAAQFMDTLHRLSHLDSRAVRLLKASDYLKTIAKQSNRFEIESLEINSEFTEFAPSFYGDTLVFSSSRKTKAFLGKQNEWTAQPYLQLYEIKEYSNDNIGVPLSFDRKFKTPLHESTTAFSKEGRIVYFTGNNLSAFGSSKDSLDIIRLKIFKATKNDRHKWKTPKSLNINNDNYSVAHPALSKDETQLYFVSDMPGGYGMSDLYVADILEDGELGEPKNLGPKINTEGRDTFPFVSASGDLYFASDGHLGLGGLDLFTVDLKDTEQKIFNLGRPINSPADDVTFIIDDQTGKGFFASNREGGMGDDDLYSFVKTKELIRECQGSVVGVVKDQEFGVILSGALVTIYDNNNAKIYQYQTANNGSFWKKMACNAGTYRIQVQKQAYEVFETTIQLTADHPTLEKNIGLIKPKATEKTIDLDEFLGIDPIYFKLNKSFMIRDYAEELDQVVRFMNTYPKLHVEVSSHTDSRGSKAFNDKLSLKRALATSDYLISKGIDPKRLSHQGHGEKLLKNRCSDGISCSEAEHQENRRSEFLVVQKR